MKTTMVEQLAHYAVALGYEEIPESARTTARQLVFDTIGTALGGYQTELGQRTVAYALSALPGSEAQLIGDGRYSSVAPSPLTTKPGTIPPCVGYVTP